MCRFESRLTRVDGKRILGYGYESGCDINIERFSYDIPQDQENNYRGNDVARRVPSPVQNTYLGSVYLIAPPFFMR